MFRPLRAAGRHDRRTRLTHVFRRNDVDESLDRINVKGRSERVDALAVAAAGPGQKGREDYFPSQSFCEHHALEELLVLIIRAALDHDGVQELRLALFCDRWRRRGDDAQPAAHCAGLTQSHGWRNRLLPVQAHTDDRLHSLGRAGFIALQLFWQPLHAAYC